MNNDAQQNVNVIAGFVPNLKFVSLNKV